MPQRALQQSVFDATLDRLLYLYGEGHRLVVSFSAGKDSGICLEMTILAARMTGNLPVDVVMRDEEILLPGSFEYAARVYARPEVRMSWLIANQPIINIYNRREPYFWVFDPLLRPEQWVRTPPGYAETIPEKRIEAMVTKRRFPPPPGKKLIAIMGLRTSESRVRRMAISSSGSFVTRQANGEGVYYARPIYDWMDGDVWRAVSENKWDYNLAYDAMHRLGLSRDKLRIAPPTMAAASAPILQIAAKAWPRWFDRVCTRLEGVRSAVHFGRRAIRPLRRSGESWEACFTRACLGPDAPEWIVERARRVMEVQVASHFRHATSPLPEITRCPRCPSSCGSWKQMAESMYMGDPFSQKQEIVPYVEPEVFRSGAGTWGGKPTW